MPSRLKRYQDQGHYHFLTFSCFRRLPYLKDDHSRTVFLKTLEDLRTHHQFLVFGYVLMPEHVHLLVSEPKTRPLATTLSVLKRETSRLLKADRPQFWQTRYYDFNLITQPKLVEKLQYIHRNPVKRGLVEKPEDWPWSSHRHWLTGDPGPVEIESHWTHTRRARTKTPPSPPSNPPPPLGCPIHGAAVGGVVQGPPRQPPNQLVSSGAPFTAQPWVGVVQISPRQPRNHRSGTPFTAKPWVG